MPFPQKLDTIYKVETPEGIHLIFRPASCIIRSLALVCDLLIQAFALFIIAFVLLNTSSFNPLARNYSLGLFLILSFIIYWWYFVLFEVLNNGQSIGKKIFNIKVIHDDGTPITWSTSLLRNLLRAVDILPSFLYGVGLITSLSTKGFKRLGDVAAGTIVIYTEPTSKITHTESQYSENPISFSFSPEEQKMIVAFAQRKDLLSVERRLELASILSEPFKLDEQGTEQMLYQISQHITGASSGSNTL